MAWCLVLVALVCGVLAPGVSVAGAATVPAAAAVDLVAAGVAGPPPPAGAGVAGPAPPAGAGLGVRGRSGWRSPLRPLVVRRFFEPPPEPWLPGHRGVDLAGRRGQLVLAAASGTVTFAGPLAGRGVVTVSHGTLRTTYEPVEPLVAVGDVVAAGAPIAKLEAGHRPATGFEARLHWGVLRGRTYLDPLLLLGLRRSRLLPVWGGRIAGQVERGVAEPPMPARPPGRASPAEPSGAGRPGPATAAVGSAAVVGSVAAVGGAFAAVAVGRSRRRRPP